MTLFKKEDLLKIAKLSALKLDEDEIRTFADQIKKVLEYTTEIENVKQKPLLPTLPNIINVFREDKAISKNSELILAQAPEKKESYFVVPPILQN